MKSTLAVLLFLFGSAAFAQETMSTSDLGLSLRDDSDAYVALVEFAATLGPNFKVVADSTEVFRLNTDKIGDVNAIDIRFEAVDPTVEDDASVGTYFCEGTLERIDMMTWKFNGGCEV